MTDGWLRLRQIRIPESSVMQSTQLHHVDPALRAKFFRTRACCASAVVFIGACMGACAVDQAAEVSAYRRVTDYAPAPVRASDAPLSLVEAIASTNAYNERLAIEGENYLQALIERRRRAANLMPTLDASAALGFRQDPPNRPHSLAFDAGLGAQYTFFTGLSDLRDIDAARANIRSREWLLLDLRESLMLETARAYYEVLTAERLVGVLESSAAVQAERLRDIRGRQQVGFARPLDVAQIESQASQTQVSLLNARNDVARARAALTLLTGTEAGVCRLTDEFALPAQGEAAEVLLNSAYASRADLLAARSAADAAREEVDGRIGQYYPSIGLNLDYFLVRDTVPSSLSAVLSVNVPVFSAGRIDADVREAWSIFRQRVYDYSLIKRSVRRDVETAHADLAASRLRLAELEAQVRVAAEALRQAEASYGAGLGTNLERIQAQDQLLSAQLGQANEEYALKIASIALMRARGGLTGLIAPGATPEPRDWEREAPASPFIRLPDGAEVTPPAPITPPPDDPALAPAPEPAPGGQTTNQPAA